MKEKVYVFGHQNPDTDSICAAISYSYMKNKMNSNYRYIPVALKKVNKETDYVLKTFDVEAPKIIKSLKPRVSDLNIGDCESVRETDSIRKILERLSLQTGRSLPVVDNNKRLIGVVSFSDIVPRILSLEDQALLKKTKTPFLNIVEELGLTRVIDLHDEKKSEKAIEGLVYLSTDLAEEKELQMLTKDDIVICNINEWKRYVNLVGAVIIGDIKLEEQKKRIQREVEKYLELDAIHYNSSVCYSEKSIFQLIKALAQTTPISDVVVKEGLVYFVTYETIDDVHKNMMSTKFRRFPVVDEFGHIKGMISRSDLVDVNKKKAILVDHNERGQSIEGIEDIDILEIIDHHRVADVQTIAPLYFRVEPVGCTCTIIAGLYEANQIDIPKKIAGLMLSAIISDTLLFHSPTCTSTDIQTAKKLAAIVGVDPKLFGMKLLTQGSNLSDETPNQLLNGDRKKFMFGEYKVTIAQINTGDFDGFFKMYESVIEEMEHLCLAEEYQLFALMVTDVVVGGTELIAVGSAKWIVDNAFDLKDKERSKFLPGVFSRKKQVVPKLMNAAKL